MRRKRESSARGHGSPPLLVRDLEPVSPEQYPTARRERKAKAPRKIVNIVLPNVRSLKEVKA